VPVKIKLTLIFTIATIITLAACKKKSEETQMVAPKNQSSEYRKLSIVIPDDITAKDFEITETGVLLLTNNGIISINYEGEMNDVIALTGSESYTCYSIDRDGNFNILAMSKNEDGNTSLTVDRFNGDGVRLLRTALKDPFDEKEDNPYIVDFLTANGHYYIQSMYGVYVYATSGELVLAVQEEYDTTANSLFLIEDGIVTSVSSRNRNNAPLLVVRLFKPDASDFIEHIISIAATSSGSLLVSNGGMGFFIVEDNGFYEYELKTGSGNQLLNLVDHGVNTGEIIGLSLVSNGDIICILPRGSILMRTAGEIVVFSTKPDNLRGTMEAYRSGEGIPSLVVDTGVPKEKEIVTLAVIDFNWWLKERVALFNRTNPDYMIVVNDYMEGRDEKDAIRQFTIDLAHDPADIIVLANWRRQSVPIHSYSRKGLFADLYEIMDTDLNFNKADYLSNIFVALELDGKLYSIFPVFELLAILGKASDLGDIAIGWTIDEFISFLDTKSEAEYIIGEWTREDFISTMIEFYFTNPETGGMKFEREAFIKILTAAERFPKTSPIPADISNPQDDMDFWNNFRSGAKVGNPLLLSRDLGGGGTGPRIERIFEYIYFCEEIAYKGLPSPTGRGTYFRPVMRFAISEQSSKKVGAWEFIKFTMNVYEHPSWWLNTNLPIKISVLEAEFAETLVNPLYGTDQEYEFGHILDWDMTISIPIGNNTPDLNAKIMEVITTTTVIAPNDLVVRDIIAEEVAFISPNRKHPTKSQKLLRTGLIYT